jgi:hypothetical protein
MFFCIYSAGGVIPAFSRGFCGWNAGISCLKAGDLPTQKRWKITDFFTHGLNRKKTLSRQKIKLIARDGKKTSSQPPQNSKKRNLGEGSFFPHFRFF